MHVRYTPGTVRLAYHLHGSGEPTVVLVRGWASHLSLDWEMPETRAWFERIMQGRRRLLRFDQRGMSLSDRPPGIETFSLETRVADVARVMDAAGVQRAALWGGSQGGSVAIAFAAQYPERVSQLILYGTFARLYAATPEDPLGLDPARGTAMLTFVRQNWGLGSRFLADVFIPDADPARLDWFTNFQRITYTRDAAADSLAALMEVDVRGLLPRVQAPTLVIHRRHDTVVPLRLGEELAAQIPDARLVVLEGEQHLPYFGDTAAVTGAADRFLQGAAFPPLVSDALSAREAEVTAPASLLSEREREVVALIARGLTNRQVAETLVISKRTADTHVAHILAKLGVASRAQVAAWAVEQGRPSAS